MIDKIKFSVIIPCFNDGLRIRRAVESCLTQSYPPYEVIIIDDGSGTFTKDAIQSIIRQYSTRNVKGFFLTDNSGVSVARNKGLDIATGDFICFLDSDDVWHPEKLHIIDTFLKKEKGTFSLSHDFTYDLREFTTIKPDLGKKMEYKTISFIHLLLKNPITTPSLIIPGYLKIRFNEKMKFAEDHDFILRLSRLTEVLFINSKLAFINRRLGSKGGLSENSWKMRKGELKMYLFFCRTNPKFYFLLPLLTVYSLIKHLRYLILKKYLFSK